MWLILLTNKVIDIFQDCIWYGVCNTDASYHNQYCSYNGTPKEMPADGLQLLAERCSFLLEEKQTKFCCDVDQVLSKSAL